MQLVFLLHIIWQWASVILSPWFNNIIKRNQLENQEIKMYADLPA